MSSRKVKTFHNSTEKWGQVTGKNARRPLGVARPGAKLPSGGARGLHALDSLDAEEAEPMPQDLAGRFDKSGAGAG